MTILLTGAAGFIGFHVARRLLERGEQVLGVDNLNEYYDVRLKKARLAVLREFGAFSFVKLDVSDRDGVLALVKVRSDLRSIIHLAAQAGVRYSLENPYAYVDANVTGTLVMLEAARRIDNLSAITYASSSSVYGANKKQPFSVDDRVDQPVSLYAATKRSCELIAHTFSHLYSVPATGLRYFTVYGPWGRPDMAAYLFTQAILAGDYQLAREHVDRFQSIFGRDSFFVELQDHGLPEQLQVNPQLIKLARDMKADGHVSGGWWNWHPNKTALEYFWRTGKFAIALAMTDDQQQVGPTLDDKILNERIGKHCSARQQVKQVGPAILAAQPIIRGCGVEDRRGGGFGEIRER